MCVIIHKPRQVEIPAAILRQCWDSNPNGAGFMYAENGKLCIQKGFMKLKKFLGAYQEIQPLQKEILIHFRLATHGKINPSQTHPFLVQNRMGIMHNGIFYFQEHDSEIDPTLIDVSIPSEKYRDSKFDMEENSDTYIFCEKVLENLPAGFENNRGIHYLLTDFLISNSSVLVMMDETGKITKLGALDGSIKENDCWFSNSYWKRQVGIWSGHNEESRKEPLSASFQGV